MTATRSRPVAPDFLWGTAISAHQSEGEGKRTPKPSAHHLGAIARAGMI
jgi:hypothetical protein